MAKEPTHTKIPRLDGGVTTRIPMPNVQRSQKTSKIGKSTGLGLRLTSANILPHALSTDKLCQVTNLVRKKTNQALQNRFAFKSPLLSLKRPISETMIVDETGGSESARSTTADAAGDPAQPSTEITKVLSRTETFTIDPKNVTVTRGEANNWTQQIRDTFHISSPQENVTKQRKLCTGNVFDTFECLMDTPAPSDQSYTVALRNVRAAAVRPDTLSYATHYMDDTVDISSNFNDITMVGDDIGYGAGRVMSSTMMCAERLIDISGSDVPVFPGINITKGEQTANNTDLLYMTRNPDEDDDGEQNATLVAVAEHSPDEDDRMEVDDRPCSDEFAAEPTTQQQSTFCASSGSGKATPAPDAIKARQRYSFGLDLPDCTLDCSIELCDSLATSVSGPHPSSPPSTQLLKKQNSFEIDESLGILTPDQMKDFLDSTNTNTNLDLLLKFPEKLAMHQCRVDQTPSPEELPLDPIEIKTDMTMVLGETADPQTMPVYHQEQQLSQTDSYSKTDQMTKSSTSKVSNSFITSVTSITSLDTGYQGDGELSRPASRGGDHSPSNLGRVVQPMRPIDDAAFHNHLHNNQNHAINQNNNQINQNIPIVRRPDPMTDSDFFTESDAEDVMHRGDRRAQIIDGHLYGAMQQQQGANVYISRQPSSQTDDSCMESSGIFTDVENRGDEDLLQHRPEHDSDMSPDGSTDTVKSTNTEYQKKTATNKIKAAESSLQTNDMDCCIASSTAHNSNEGGDRVAGTISDAAGVVVADDSRTAAAEAPTAQPTSAHNSNVSNRPSPAKTVSSTSTTSSSPAPSIDKLHGSGSKLLATKKASPIRKQNKNEANVALKKHEFLSKHGGSSSGGVGASSSNAGCVVSKLTKASASSLLSSADSAGDIENQENKRPAVVSGSALSSPSGGTVVVSAGAVYRKSPQNKWDAVMNKIATNKTTVKTKNYSEVKSKVTCGIARRDSPGLLKSPPAMDQQLLPTKRTLLSSSKRGRTNSKDSSQSDISVSGAINKPILVTPTHTRTAKKRDVRAISISPSDLGPPTKSVGSVKANNLKPAPLQKRYAPVTSVSPVLNNNNHNNNINNNNNQAIDTKCTSSSKKIGSKVAASKTPLKDHNRLVGLTTTTQPSLKSTVGAKNTSKSIHASTQPLAASTPTPPEHHNGINITTANGKANGLLRNGIVQKVVTVGDHKTATNANQIGRIANNTGKLNDSSGSPTAAASLPTATSNGISRANKSVAANLPTPDDPKNLSVEALGVVIQYLVFHLDAFGNNKSLADTKVQLDDARMSCSNLEEQLIVKDDFYSSREKDMHDLHRCELGKAQQALTELESCAKERISALESELVRKDTECSEKLQSYLNTYNIHVAEQEAAIQLAKDKEEELLKRISALSTTENELREKVHASESDFGERIRAASMRERELTDKVNNLNRQLDAFNREAEGRERLLQEKLTLSQDEIVVLRHSNSMTEQQPIAATSSQNRISVDRPQLLQDEVESLRCVLELKQNEISDLRKQNHELMKNADALPVALVKISGLETRLEDLQIQLQCKTDDEKNLLHRYKHLEQIHTHEVSNRKNLSLHNEQLQWKLMQNSGKVAMAITELSKHYQDHSGFLSETKASLYGQENTSQCDGSLIRNGSNEFLSKTSSPPSTPVIKGVVEKSDSVSWVVEINDEESAEALASRIVRRVGSFRSSSTNSERHSQHQQTQQAKKRQLSSGGSNPLSQSASAASILHQYAESSSPIAQKHSSTSSRTRSKSVSTHHNNKSPRDGKKVVRSNSSAGKSGQVADTPAWSLPICSSSPRCEKRVDATSQSDLLLSEESEIEESPKSRTRSNSFSEDCDYIPFRRHNSYKPSKRGGNAMITCSTAALTAAQRPDLMVPGSSAAGDCKKFHQIKESAGEAMVSGTNSEDEASTGSSDESMSVSSHTNSSQAADDDAVGGRLADAQRHASLEDVLMHKIVASLGSPIEEGWSEDGGDHDYVNESLA